jgi:hypothetical protein
MSDKPEDRRSTLLQLMEELQRLEEEHRTLDLRDPNAVEQHQQKIDALRQKIQSLDRPRGNGVGYLSPSTGMK